MCDDTRLEIIRLCDGNVHMQVPMCEITSMKVGGVADCLAFPPSVDRLAHLVSVLTSAGIPFLVGGNWTNVIIRDGGYRGVLISLQHLRGMKRWHIPDGGEKWAVEAGVPLAHLVKVAMEGGLTGVEFCAGIPGSVGGAVKMNAGAWGKEMKDIIDRVTVVDRRGHKREVMAGELVFRYRVLDLDPGDIVVEAVLGLQPGDREKIVARVEEIMTWRREHHPLAYPSSGSIFKNPPLTPAGRLIEEAGLKGVRIGGARVSEKHANFIVNVGNATAADVIDLIELIQREVMDRQGISLETEVVIAGDDEA